MFNIVLNQKNKEMDVVILIKMLYWRNSLLKNDLKLQNSTGVKIYRRNKLIIRNLYSIKDKKNYIIYYDLNKYFIDNLIILL